MSKMKMTIKKLCLLFFILLIYGNASAKIYFCTPVNLEAKAEYGLGLFKIELDDNCLKLFGPEKSQQWNWKIVQKNGGELDGVRNFCDGKDSGWIGSPIFWSAEKKTLIIFGKTMRLEPTSSIFGCQEKG